MASSIAFTAVLGVIVVLLLPLLVPVLLLSLTQYGVLAGLTVYAVPQVLAISTLAGCSMAKATACNDIWFDGELPCSHNNSDPHAQLARMPET